MTHAFGCALACADKAGAQQTQLMEDVWLGSVLYRFPLSTPLTYVSLHGLHVDAWDLRLTRTALLIHNPNKRPGDSLARQRA